MLSFEPLISKNHIQKGSLYWVQWNVGLKIIPCMLQDDIFLIGKLMRLTSLKCT